MLTLGIWGYPIFGSGVASGSFTDVMRNGEWWGFSSNTLLLLPGFGAVFSAAGTNGPPLGLCRLPGSGWICMDFAMAWLLKNHGASFSRYYSDILSCLCGSHDLMLLIITYVPVFRGQWREVTIEKPLKLTWLEVLHHHWWKPPRMTSPRRWWWIFYRESSPSHDLSGELWTIIIPHDGSMVLVY